MPQKGKSQVKIKITQLEKEYYDSRGGTHKALNGVDLEIYEGEFFCLLGPSGCGKSTLLHILAGFEKPTKGEIIIDERVVEKPEHGRLVLFQDYGLFPWRNVLGNVEYGLEVKNIPSVVRKDIAMEFIKLTGLEKFINSHPHELSGGMQQRVALARALAVDPDIIFMDEPFGALDAITRLKMQEEVISIWSKKKKTIVFVTHDIGEAVFLADRVGIMSSKLGKINKIIDISLSRPRSRADYNQIKLQEIIYREFAMTVTKELEFSI